MPKIRGHVPCAECGWDLNDHPSDGKCSRCGADVLPSALAGGRPGTCAVCGRFLGGSSFREPCPGCGMPIARVIVERRDLVSTKASEPFGPRDLRDLAAAHAQCHACGYDRSGVEPEARCPECGAAPPEAMRAEPGEPESRQALGDLVTGSRAMSEGAAALTFGLAITAIPAAVAPVPCSACVVLPAILAGPLYFTGVGRLRRACSHVFGRVEKRGIRQELGWVGCGVALLLGLFVSDSFAIAHAVRFAWGLTVLLLGTCIHVSSVLALFRVVERACFPGAMARPMTRVRIATLILPIVAGLFAWAAFSAATSAGPSADAIAVGLRLASISAVFIWLLMYVSLTRSFARLVRQADHPRIDEGS